MSEPTTKAAQALMRRPHRAWPKGAEEWADTLAIIEAEAKVAALAEVETKVDGLRDAGPGFNARAYDFAIQNVIGWVRAKLDEATEDADRCRRAGPA